MAEITTGAMRGCGFGPPFIALTGRPSSLIRSIQYRPESLDFPGSIPYSATATALQGSGERPRRSAKNFMTIKLALIILFSVNVLSAAPIIEIKKVAGKTANEVESVLGAPSQTETVKQGTKRFYMKGAIEIVFINDKADWITVTPTKMTSFTKEALGELGLPVREATFSNQHVLKWEPFDDYQSISIFPGPDGIDYIYVMTQTR